jgi:hypothetical protein
MATEHKTHAHAHTEHPKGGAVVGKPEPSLNPLVAPDTKPLKKPAVDTWQEAFWNIAEDLDNTGNQWLGHIFRAQSQKP